jgi:RNA recognition motif-containing protein
LDELKRKRAGKAFRSVLVDNDAAIEDPEQGGILLDGRALSVVAAVDRDSAHKLKLVEQTEKTDKRRLGLLQESLIKPATSVAGKFWSTEDVKERQAMVKARLNDLRRNANSIVSDVRLSVRHLPTAVTEDQLRQVVEHAMEEGLKHSSEVLADHPVHRENASKVKARLKQVKIVRATGEERESRAGRSKGFGFVEFTQPSHALLALRYLTNNIPDAWHRQLPEVFGRRIKHGATAEKKKVVLAKGKPIVPVVEFAIDKVAVLTKTGAVENKKQIHRKKLEKPDHGKAPKRPGFNQKQPSKSKRPRN